MRNKLFFLTLPFVFSPAYSADLYSLKDLIGCGTVISVRNLNQEPMYNMEYMASVGGPTNASEVGIVAKLIPGGELAAIAVGIVAGAVIDSAKSAPILKVIPPKGGTWRMVKAVRIGMDDGRVVNLPLMNADRFVYGHHYEEGQRLALTYSKAVNNIVIGPRGRKTPKVGEKYFEKYCGLHASKEDADAILAASANLIDEANIISE